MDKLDQQMILEYLRSNKNFFESKFGVTKIALFGSFARDEAHGESDIDLLIEVKHKSFKNRFYLKEHLENKFKRKVDITYFSSVRLFIRTHIEKDLVYA